MAAELRQNWGGKEKQLSDNFHHARNRPERLYAACAGLVSARWEARMGKWRHGAYVGGGRVAWMRQGARRKIW